MPVVLAIALWWLNAQRAKTILASYPQSWEFNYAVKSHLEFKPERGREGQTTFFATWFLNGQTGTQMTCSASGDGSSYFGRMDFVESTYGWTVVSSKGSRLTNSQFLRLRTLLTQVPASSPPVERGHLLLVTFNRGNSTETRVYDRNDVPEAVESAFQTLGAPLATVTPIFPPLAPD